MNTGALALSSLLVLGAALVIPAWRNKRHVGSHADAVRVLSVVTLAAAVAATAWIVLQVLAVGVHHTARARGGSFPGSVFGVPVMVIPLAILVVIAGAVEALIRSDERTPVPAMSGVAAAPNETEIAQVRQPAAEQARDLAVAIRRRFKADKTLEHVHNQFVAGEVYSETVTADAIAQIESRWTRLLEQQARVQESTHDAVQELHGSADASASDTAAALQRVTEMCGLVTDGLEALERERHVLVEAIALLGRRVAPRPSPQLEVLPTVEISIVDINAAEAAAAAVAAPIAPRRAAPIAVPPSPKPVEIEVVGYEPTLVRTSMKRMQERMQERIQRAGRRMWTRMGPATDPALTALRIRFAQGEIDSSEYAARVEQLSPVARTGAGHHPEDPA